MGQITTQPNIRERSGSFLTNDRLVVFLYMLLRDRLSAGSLEGMISTMESEYGPQGLSNGWVAKYAEDVAERLLKPFPIAEEITESAT